MIDSSCKSVTGGAYDSRHSAAKIAPLRAFPALDGLRGIAAIAVVAFHMGAHRMDGLFANAYLTVDLFFVLSGFVLSHAYGARLANGISWQAFMRLRFIRLYPAYIAGLAIGVTAYLVQEPVFRIFRVFAQFAMALVSALAFIPWPVSLPGRPALFPFDEPTWSLFFELGANLVLVVCYRRLSNRVLWVLIGICALALYAIAWKHGSLFVGWNMKTLIGGFPRAGFSFFVGVLLQRYLPQGMPGIGGIGPLVMLLAVATLIFPVPRIYDALVVTILYPLCIAAAAGWQPSGFASVVAEWLGDASYPLYVIHVPFLYSVQFFTSDWNNPRSTLYWLTIVGLVVVAWGIARFYERPLRRRWRPRPELNRRPTA